MIAEMICWSPPTHLRAWLSELERGLASGDAGAVLVACSRIAARHRALAIQRRGRPYLNRWTLAGTPCGERIYLHQFVASDDQSRLLSHMWDGLFYSGGASGVGRVLVLHRPDTADCPDAVRTG